ncbi:MAG: putative bifunctional diguanylate cyclase/phosphodiesterase [Acidimicrobiales bacterium]
MLGLGARRAGPTGLSAGATVPLVGSALGLAFTTGEPRAHPDLARSPHPEHQRLVEAGLRSAASAPVRIHGAVRGVLNVGSVERDAFDADAVATLATFTRLLGATMERIHAQEEVAASERRARALIDDSPMMLASLTADGQISQVSRFGAGQLGYEPEELVGLPFAELHPAEDRALLADRLAELAGLEDEVRSFEARMVRRDGQVVWARQSARVVRALDGAPRLLVVCEDVSEVRKLAQQLEHQASHDPLTGLPNRREFSRRLDAALARARDHGERACVCFFDLDHFKIVNDTCGHRAGDALLCDLVTVLTGKLAARDTLARIGGDEFALLLEACTLPDGLRVAERLRTAVEGLAFRWDGKPFGVSLSGGVVAVDADTADTALVLADADAACYAAKAQGRNRISIARPDDEVTRQRRSEAEWVTRARAALAEDRLVLHGQLITPVRWTDERLRLEVLVRMLDEDGRPVPPGAFIPAAERYGLIGQIDQWVVRNVLAQLARRKAKLERLDLCTVNLSARSVEDEAFLEFVLSELRGSAVHADRVTFEITETAAMAQIAQASRFIEAVAALGCRFALDDFGSGFSTFSHLKHLPVDFIKIDGALVRDIAADPVDRAMVRAIHDLADAMGLQTIAEFVEDQVILARLHDIGVDYAQGYGIERPRPLEELLDRL